ncbi:hypothetical protein QN377_15310 [Pseudomonas sp. CCC4.1]|nr:hypothetical protein [Pseudomonas sp. CCC4.1]
MMRADLDELMVVSCLCPAMKWSSSVTRPVLISREGNVLRLYWMPLLLCLDEYRAGIFIGQLNRNGDALTE